MDLTQQTFIPSYFTPINLAMIACIGGAHSFPWSELSSQHSLLPWWLAHMSADRRPSFLPWPFTFRNIYTSYQLLSPEQGGRWQPGYLLWPIFRSLTSSFMIFSTWFNLSVILDVRESYSVWLAHRGQRSSLGNVSWCLTVSPLITLTCVKVVQISGFTSFPLSIG